MMRSVSVHGRTQVLHVAQVLQRLGKVEPERGAWEQAPGHGASQGQARGAGRLSGVSGGGHRHHERNITRVSQGDKTRIPQGTPQGTRLGFPKEGR
jgi:hypothetical protein